MVGQPSRENHPQPSAGLWEPLPVLRGLRGLWLQDEGSQCCWIHHCSHHSVASASAALPGFAFGQSMNPAGLPLPAKHQSQPAPHCQEGSGAEKRQKRDQENRTNSTKAAHESPWSCVYQQGWQACQCLPASWAHRALPLSSSNSQLLPHPRPLRTFLYSMSSPFPPWCFPKSSTQQKKNRYCWGPLQQLQSL